MTSTVADLSEVARSAATLRGFLHGLPGVDQVGAEARAATLATRSIKTTAKARGIDLAIRMVDLTTLEGSDTPGKVRARCAKARRASWLAMLAGADFIKTSTGKISPAATLPVTLVMLEAVRDFRAATGRVVGVKPAGGIRNTKDAMRYLVLVNETVGADWLDPDRFRFGASSLLNDLLLQRNKLATGRYSGPDYVTLD